MLLEVSAMRKMVRRLLGGEEGGIGTLMVVGFVAISVPMLTAALALAGTLSHDSQVKNNLAKNQYSSIGAIQYVRYLGENPERWDDWLEEFPEGETLNIDDDEIEIEASSGGFADQGFLGYCIFGSSYVMVKENSTVNCNIGSNGNIDIKENSNITGDIVSGGNVMLKENVVVNGDVIAAGTVTLKSLATVNGTIQQGPRWRLSPAPLPTTT
jgi:hypothetical protein